MTHYTHIIMQQEFNLYALIPTIKSPFNGRQKGRKKRKKKVTFNIQQAVLKHKAI